MAKRVLTILPERYAVCRLDADAVVPAWANGDGFCSVTRTAEELSIVCREALLPHGVQAERGWRVVQLQGPIDFSETGVLCGLLAPLAEAKIGVFAISTFDTDYILLKEVECEEATRVWAGCGHTVLMQQA